MEELRMKYIATATRKNVDGKPDYRWVHSHSNGFPVLFDTAKEAQEHAEKKCSDQSLALYNPVAEDAGE